MILLPDAEGNGPMRVATEASAGISKSFSRAARSALMGMIGEFNGNYLFRCKSTVRRTINNEENILQVQAVGIDLGKPSSTWCDQRI